jgi:hypothetical protein
MDAQKLYEGPPYRYASLTGSGRLTLRAAWSIMLLLSLGLRGTIWLTVFSFISL